MMFWIVLRFQLFKDDILEQFDRSGFAAETLNPVPMLQGSCDMDKPLDVARRLHDDRRLDDDQAVDRVTPLHIYLYEAADCMVDEPAGLHSLLRNTFGQWKTEDGLYSYGQDGQWKTEDGQSE